MINTDLKRILLSNKTWYKEIWTLSIQEETWVEETKKQVAFICSVLNIKGNEKILDLACGYGRHSIELGKMGCKVVGIDITKDYIEEAKRQANIANIKNEYYCKDIRDIEYENEFDIVLNMADGAIGYLESNEENEKIFTVASKALRCGGKHLIDITNGGFAKKHFPCRNWQYGEKSLALADFTWDSENRIMFYGGKEIRYGQTIEKATDIECDPIRLYLYEELRAIYKKYGMETKGFFSDFNALRNGTDDDFQVQIFAMKN